MALDPFASANRRADSKAVREVREAGEAAAKRQAQTSIADNKKRADALAAPAKPYKPDFSFRPG